MKSIEIINQLQYDAIVESVKVNCLVDESDKVFHSNEDSYGNDCSFYGSVTISLKSDNYNHQPYSPEKRPNNQLIKGRNTLLFQGLFFGDDFSKEFGFQINDEPWVDTFNAALQNFKSVHQLNLLTFEEENEIKEYQNYKAIKELIKSGNIMGLSDFWHRLNDTHRDLIIDSFFMTKFTPYCGFRISAYLRKKSKLESPSERIVRPSKSFLSHLSYQQIFTLTEISDAIRFQNTVVESHLNEVGQAAGIFGPWENANTSERFFICCQSFKASKINETPGKLLYERLSKFLT